ncbi:leucine-rich PPR motif-containing protein, mitochondrial [Copidosoma floridanum]|uniref:leucine-rich PPR motif-containing protein, mitochondrial n=1 Tax=Copidosoma floridanum TaxID=29053 RepID=UPI000C6F4FEC|nr:leucine-rich PPR motif-containing protein, mitochondrial [Copidosoma floridanum]
MATMLHSLRFVRRLNAGCRRLGVSALHRAPTASLTASQRNYVTNAATARRDFDGSTNVDDLLREIDRKSKRFGFVFKWDLEQVLQTVSYRGTMTSMQALLLIRCCGFFMIRESIETRQSYVNRVWDVAKSLNVPMDVSHYNALLLVYLDNDTDFSPLEILVELKEKNITPNRVTFQRLIEQYCKKGDIAGATKILEHMSEHDIPLNESIFNSLILGHSSADDVPSALKILDIMKQANVEPTSRTYAAIMCVHAKQGDIGSIKSVLDECRNKDITFTDKEILDVIYTLAINKHEDYVDELLSNVDKSSNYNRNTITAICKLLDKHEDHVAYKLQKSLVKVSSNYSDEFKSDGQLFLKKLITNTSDVNTIIKYCNLMVEENVNTSAFENALFFAYKNNLPHLAFPLLKAMKNAGRDVREHYFYPILVANNKSNNFQGTFSTVKTMMTDFGISPLILTIKDYVIPYMVGDYISNLTTLINNNLSFSTATNAILLHLLENNKIRQAVKFITNTQMLCRVKLLERPLIQAFLSTKDVNSLVKILHYNVCTSGKKPEEQNNVEQDEDTKNLYNPYKLVNYVISEIVKELSSYDIEVISNILQELLDSGIALERATVDQIKKKLGKSITSEIENNLTLLTSENLKPMPLKKNTNVKEQQFRSKNLSYLEEKAETSIEHKMMLVQERAKLMNLAAVEKLQKELDEQNPTYSIGYCASLMEFYSKAENVEEADKWYKRLQEVDANISLDKAKVLNYANVLVKSDRWMDALNILEHSVRDEDTNREKACERLLITVSKICPDQMETFFKKLLDRKLITEVTATMLSPIIKYHLNAGDLEKALEKFKWACNTYKVTPHKSGLMTKLIQNEDAKTLQDVTGLCTQIYGESNALFDLAVCFFECDRPKQARKILETPGLRIKPDRVRYTASNYAYNHETEQLEKFIKLVSGLRYEHNQLYNMLLDLYEKENNWEKSLALWTQMQEDNVQPSVKFMNQLENILRTNNQAVPIAKSEEAQVFESSVENFRKAIENGQISEAKEILVKIPEDIRSNYLLQLIDHYLDVEDIDEALKNLKDFWEMQHKSEPPFQRTVSSILEKLINSNDFQNIFQVMIDTKQFCKKRNQNFTFTYTLNKTFYESNKYEDLFDYMEKLLNDKAVAENIALMFHSTVAVQYLLDKPEFEEKFKNFAFKASEYNVNGPLNTLWIHKFLSNSPDTESFFKEHLNVFQSINAMYACKETGAWNKMPELSKFLTESNIKYDNKRKNVAMMLRLIENADIPNKYNIAFECLRNVVKVVPLNAINKNLINPIEENCEDKEAFEALRTDGESKPRSQEAATG